MSIVYVNNFDHLLHSSSTPEEVTGSMAALDSPIFVPGRPVAFLGPMHAGASVPPPAATIEPSTTVLGHPPFDFRLSEGTTVTISNAAIYQSRTFYAVAPNQLLLSRGSVFQAELVFDRPAAVLDPGATGKVWAIQLIFKTGDATDHSNGDPSDPTDDVKLGSTCQFNDAGYVKFHGTDNQWVGPTTATYSDYFGNPLTEFRLAATMAVGNGGAITGIGSLQYDSNLQWGHLSIPNIPGTSQPITADKLTAAGFMLTTLGGFASHGARLRSYTLSVT
jgi:hypothetical protein